MIRTRYVAAWALLFTALFFIEYTPVLPRMLIPYDLPEFHFPLVSYAFQALKHGRFPQWDPTIYSGLSFADNITVGIFYPPMWLMFALKWGSAKLSYQALEYLALAHVWLAFVLCYAWLYGRRKLHWLASLLGAGGYAFGGYMLEQLQHLGFLAGYAWLPLAFLSIDEAAQLRRWRPLWKLAFASSMCLLGGYPPFWLVFALSAAAYAFARPFERGRPRLGLWVLAALGCSLAFCSIALLPAAEATGLRMQELKYSWVSGFKHLEYYLSYLIPNYFKFDLGVDPDSTAFKDYLYLGAALLAGLPLLLWRKKFWDIAPLLASLLASLMFLVNPWGGIGWVLQRTFLGQMTVDWDFYAGVSAALAPLAAFGLDYAFRRTPAKPHPATPWAAAVSIALAAAWSIRLIVLWNGAGVASGWKSGLDSLGGIALCAAMIYLFPRNRGWLRGGLAAALLLLSASEYKAFGTSKQFNGSPRKYFVDYTRGEYPAMNADTFADLQQHSQYRWVVEDFGPDPVRLRHFGFSTPQGFDPNIPAQYKTLIDRIGHFETNRVFNLAPEQPSTLRLLGAGYVIVSKRSPGYSRLLADPNFQLMQPDDSYFKVFQLLDPQPPYGWEQIAGDRSVEAATWKPERRAFHLRSAGGGVFRLSEQFYPGWSATLDGTPAAIERCHLAFQCVAVAPGEHLLEFRYRARWLLPGAAISFCSILLAIVFVRRADTAVPVPAPDPAPPRNRFDPRALFKSCVRYFRRLKPNRAAAAVMIAAFFWAFHARTLKAPFGPDEMMNIYGYWDPPLWKVLLANLTFWTTFVRPFAAAYYLPLFHLFKLDPVPYSWIRMAMLAVNTVLFYKIARSVSRSWWVAVLATLPVAYHAGLAYLAYNGAFIYDALCGGFYFAALLYYIHARRNALRNTPPLRIKQACIFLVLYLCALNSKEMAVSLPIVVLAYELLFHERAKGVANLAKQLSPALAAGAITAIYVLGKTLGADTLTATSAYRPILTWARFSESTTRFLNSIFYAEGITMEHAVAMWGALLCAGVVGLLRFNRDPRWMFLWVWVTVTPLPIVFLPGRNGGQLYLIAAGWALAAAMLCRALAWRLTRELFIGRRARLWAMSLLLLVCVNEYAQQTRTIHRERIEGVLRTGQHTADIIAQFKALNLHPRPGSRILFLRDPFPATYDMLFVAALVWTDHSLQIWLQSQSHFDRDHIAGMDYVLDYTGDGFVTVKTPPPDASPSQ